MTRALKVALLFLVAFALPLQSASAVVVQVCGSNHHRAAQQAAAEADQHMPQPANFPHSHEPVMSHHVAAGDPTDNPGGEHSQHALTKCAACAVCCSGSAMTYTSYVSAIAAAPKPLLTLSDDSRFAGVVLEGPKRPPREILA